uniref:alkaline phosphatase family protein n=1 Tax=Acetatifactor sp. TaxID=1872090 RepID=UPI004057848A
MRIKYPDYNNCIANLACSVLNYYGIQPPNSTLKAADALLHKEYKNVVVLLLDGMGVSSMKKHLKPDGFFRRNMKCTYSSTFPPTTVAATTAVDSGLLPNQSGWLGWTGYFKELDRNVIYFWNIDNDNGEEIQGLNAAWTYVPYESIRDQIRKAGTDAYYLAPFLEPYYSGYHEFCAEIKRLCDMDSRKYIYAYWDEPDHSMHDFGVDGENIRELLTDIERYTELLASELSDTLLIITADHGHINTRNTSITYYSDIFECLQRMPSMETRALNLFIKPGMEAQFEEAFHKHYDGEFILMSKAEVIKRKLLGHGDNHSRLDEMLGDYLAVAISDVAIGNVPGGNKGNHAGLTKAEMEIPLIAVEIK